PAAARPRFQRTTAERHPHHAGCRDNAKERNSMITMYGIPNCDTIKKARAWLDRHGIEYRFHDYKKAGIDEATLRLWSRELSVDDLINKRGTTWRRLDEAER